MSTYSTTSLTCACGHQVRVTVASSVNTARTPEVREALRSGSFHRFMCPRCGRSCVADSPFLYLDPDRRIMLRVGGPAGDSSDPIVQAALASLAISSQSPGRWTVLDSASIAEGLMALEDAERNANRERMERIVVNAELPPQERRSVRFFRDKTGDAARKSWHRTRDLFHNSVDRVAEVAASIADAPTQADAMNAITRLGALLAGGQWIPRPVFREMEEAIQVVAGKGWNEASKALADLLLGVELSKDFPDVARDSLRDTLRAVPWRDARGNSALHRIDCVSPPGDTRAASYDWVAGVLTVGVHAASDPQSLRRKLVHEIGHGVHDNNRPAIDTWLRARYGWEMYRADLIGPDDALGVERWVKDLGGWPEAWNPETKAIWRRRIRDAVIDRGSESGGFPRSLIPPASASAVLSEIRRELDAAAPTMVKEVESFLPYRLMQMEMFCWFDHVHEWPHVGDRLFSFNYFYGGLMVVRSTILNLLRTDAATVATHLLGTYAAMSPMEFFAEFYVWLHSLTVGAVALPDFNARREVSRLSGRWRTFKQLNGRERDLREKSRPSWDWATDQARDSRADPRARIDSASPPD